MVEVDKGAEMETLTSGTTTGAGSFRCQRCDYVLTLLGSDMLTACPSGGGEAFARASLFRAGAPDGGRSERESTLAPRRAGWDSDHEDRRLGRGGVRGALNTEDTLADRRLPGAISELKREALLSAARERIEGPGEYLVYEESGEWRTVAL